MKTKSVKITNEGHEKYTALKQAKGKTFMRLLDDGADALEILPRMITALEKGQGNHKLLAEAKAIL